MPSALSSTPTSVPPGRRGWLSGRRGAAVVAVAIAALVVLGVGLYLFQPWRLFTTTVVVEASPLDASAPSSAAPSPITPSPSASPRATVIAAGTFRSFEHSTTGTALLIRRADGSAVVRLENFATSDGPDVRVWLSSREAAQADSAGDAPWVEVGPLRGNRGSQNYAVPARTDLSRYRSVVIWCRRFSVAFGAAPLVR